MSGDWLAYLFISIMKKVLSILAVMVISITVSAQAPFTTFEPAKVPQRSYSSPSLPSLFPDADALEERWRREAQEKKIVSSEIVTVDGFNYVSQTYFPLKVRTIQRRNGQVEHYCLGIKKNGAWSTCEKQILSLDVMFKQATTDSDKSMILELMEYGSFLLIMNDSEMYIIK